MIVVDAGDRLQLVTQEHHAHLTGALAVLMPPGALDHDAFIAAARIHDNGWREADAVPTVDSTGTPHTFSSVDDDTYEAVWRRGIERAIAADALVGLLVSLHGARFFGPRKSNGMRALADQTMTRQARLLTELGLGGTPDELPAAVRQASDRIAFLDTLSLMLCGALPDELTPIVDKTEYRLRRRGTTVAVAPWPFDAAATAFSVTTHTVPPGPYATDASLQDAVATAHAQQHTVRISPQSTPR